MKTLAVLLVLLVQQITANSQDVELITKATNEFALKLFKITFEDSINVALCSLSLHLGLTLIQQGAQGKTASELTKVLGYSGTSIKIKDGYKSLLIGVQDNSMKMATKLYTAIDINLNKDFIAVTRQNFLSDIEGVNFGKSAEATNNINQWVEKKTNHKIHNLVTPDVINEATRLVIVNAFYFNNTWKKPFTTADDMHFWVKPEQKVKAKIMIQTSHFEYNYDYDLEATILKMDYTHGNYSMLFILPDEDTNLPALEDKVLNNTEIQSILKNLRTTEITVAIPKFKLEYTLDLDNVLKKMGIEEMFSPQANFQGISNKEKFYVNNVIQKSIITVYENGTEGNAAAGPTKTMANYITRPFYADHPFCFTLIKNNQIIFAGHLVNPTQESD